MTVVHGHNNDPRDGSSEGFQPAQRMGVPERRSVIPCGETGKTTYRRVRVDFTGPIQHHTGELESGDLDAPGLVGSGTICHDIIGGKVAVYPPSEK